MTPTKTPTTKPAKPVLDAIAKGTYDPHLVNIAEAISERILATGAVARWKITFDDVEVTEDDITIDEASTLERMLKKPWTRISPASSALDCRAVLAVVLMERKGLTAEKADERLKSLTFADALGTLSIY